MSIFSYAHWSHILWTNVSWNPLSISKLVYLFFQCQLVKDPYISWLLPSMRYMIYKYFLPYCGLSFHFLGDVLGGAKFLILMRSYLYFLWLLMVLLSHLRKNCLIQGHEDLILCFLLTVIVLAFKSVIHFWVNFCVWSKVGVSVHCFSRGYPKLFFAVEQF